VRTTYEHKRPGDIMRIGDLLGHPVEPVLVWARVTGFLHQVEGRNVIVRTFTDSDLEAGRAWPTGEYRMAWLCVPYDGPADPAQWRLRFVARRTA
jgi:hypothetical protein